MNFYYIADKSCDGTWTLVIKEPHKKKSEAFFYLTKSEVYARISVALDAVMSDTEVK